MQMHGIAAVSADFFLSRKVQDTPFDWTSPEDFLHLQEQLDQADGCVMGRVTHDLHPNIRKRRRVILTRENATTLQKNEDELFLNPAQIDPASFLQKICDHCGGDTICILGGAETYRYWLQAFGYTSFDLSIEHAIRLEEGVSMFADAQATPLNPCDYLSAHKMKLISQHPLNSAGSCLYRFTS